MLSLGGFYCIISEGPIPPPPAFSYVCLCYFRFVIEVPLLVHSQTNDQVFLGGKAKKVVGISTVEDFLKKTSKGGTWYRSVMKVGVLTGRTRVIQCGGLEVGFRAVKKKSKLLHAAVCHMSKPS